MFRFKSPATRAIFLNNKKNKNLVVEKDVVRSKRSIRLFSSSIFFKGFSDQQTTSAAAAASAKELKDDIVEEEEEDDQLLRSVIDQVSEIEKVEKKNKSTTTTIEKNKIPLAMEADDDAINDQNEEARDNASPTTDQALENFWTNLQSLSSQDPAIKYHPNKKSSSSSSSSSSSTSIMFGKLAIPNPILGEEGFIPFDPILRRAANRYFTRGDCVLEYSADSIAHFPFLKRPSNLSQLLAQQQQSSSKAQEEENNNNAAGAGGGIDELKKAVEFNIPEIAFAGRSNVGKSSLLNAILNRKKVSKVSNTPGHTKRLNFFSIKPPTSSTSSSTDSSSSSNTSSNTNAECKMFLVDMPGYGFAETASVEITDQWRRMIKQYITTRRTLRKVLVLVDARRGLQIHDLHFLEFLEKYGVSNQIVFTKCDKIYDPSSSSSSESSSSVRQKQEEELLKVVDQTYQIIEPLLSCYPLILPTSSRTMDGIEELRCAIFQGSGMEQYEKMLLLANHDDDAEDNNNDVNAALVDEKMKKTESLQDDQTVLGSSEAHQTLEKIKGMDSKKVSSKFPYSFDPKSLVKPASSSTTKTKTTKAEETKPKQPPTSPTQPKKQQPQKKDSEKPSSTTKKQQKSIIFGL